MDMGLDYYDLFGMGVDLAYSLFQKKRTFNSNFFCEPPGGGGPQIHMVDCVTGSPIHAHFFR